MQKKKNFLVYCGNPGIGKTHLIAALFPWAIKNFSCFRYHNERQLLNKVRESMSNFTGDYLTALKLLIDDDVVFLDDIGSEKHNEFREDVIFDAIDQRYSSMKPTVITSNYSISEFKRIYHPRVCSRLFASENVIIEVLDGEDQRQK